jgi:hypothetical protein
MSIFLVIIAILITCSILDYIFKQLNTLKAGTMSIGIKAPLVKEGDSLNDVVLQSLKNSKIKLADNDIIGITESLVARTQGNYCTVNQIVQWMDQYVQNRHLVLVDPIMSRNRFSIILKAFARYADSILMVFSGEYDQQGNPVYGQNMFTGVNMIEYYKHICQEEHCEFKYGNGYIENKMLLVDEDASIINNKIIIDCRCHPHADIVCHYDLKDIMSGPVLDNTTSEFSGYNEEYGLLGSNKAGEERLKLFPRHCSEIVNTIKDLIWAVYKADVEVMIYADGCFKDPIGGIWEFADPVTSPGYTKGLEGTPKEVKIKYLIDNNINPEKAIKNALSIEDISDMNKQGTTPRRYVDLIASLMDLTSGSGSKGTPIVVVKNYFKQYGDK